jgi:hypothetical protein
VEMMEVESTERLSAATREWLEAWRSTSTRLERRSIGWAESEKYLSVPPDGSGLAGPLPDFA